MVPAAFVVLAALPLTPNGKVDRRALPVPDSSPAERSRTVTEPRDPLEFQLTNLWEKLLGTRPIGIRDRFFDLGGHSLLAARLFAEINHFFGKNLPLATLLQAPTVEQLAAVLRHDGWTPPWSSLVPIQSGGQRLPLYFIHANGGNILSFIGLVRHLSSDQPVYGLQAVGLDGRQAPLVRVEDMAEHYLTEIRRVQPRGPYSLCGLSFGGVIAFEMAQRLHLQGEEVAFLGLLDTTCPGYRIPLRDRLTFHLTQLRQLGLRGKFGYVKQAIQREFERRTYKSYLDNDQVLPSVLHDISSISFQAERKYVPRVYPGRITFFRATERLAGDQDPELSWGKLTTGGLEVHDVPGHHANFHEEEPNVGILAEKLTACLDVVAATYKPAPGDRSMSQPPGG